MLNFRSTAVVWFTGGMILLGSSPSFGQSDCNNNGIDDAIDIADCPPGDVSCADCNANGIPDGCETHPPGRFFITQSMHQPFDYISTLQFVDQAYHRIPDAPTAISSVAVDFRARADLEELYEWVGVYLISGQQWWGVFLGGVFFDEGGPVSCPDTPEFASLARSVDPAVFNRAKAANSGTAIFRFDPTSLVDACLGSFLEVTVTYFGTADNDCNANGVPDECDVAHCGGDLACGDCNTNGTPDGCDIRDCPAGLGALCRDCDGDGVMDGCDVDPCPCSSDSDCDDVTLCCNPATKTCQYSCDPAASRYLSVWPGGWFRWAADPRTAIRVTMVSLQTPDPPNHSAFPPQDFSAYERGAGCTDPGGCERWIGPLGTYFDRPDVPYVSDAFLGSRLQCTPYYHDWTTASVIHVTGAEIVPSSLYHLQAVPYVCLGREGNCPEASAPVPTKTARWGDVAEPFQRTCAESGCTPCTAASCVSQPNALDVTALLNKFRALTGAAPKYLTQLQPNLVDLNAALNSIDITNCVNAFRSRVYGYAGPCPCPSQVPCEVTSCGQDADCVALYGSGATCFHLCAGGANDGEPCTRAQHCKQCVGGLHNGYPCDPANVYACTNGACSTDGTCGPGFCRDACGRCN